MTNESTKSFYLWVDGKHHKVPEAIYIRFRQMEAVLHGLANILELIKRGVSNEYPKG